MHAEAASSDLPRTVDALQEQVGQGPCRHRLTAEQAFAALVRSSQDRNLKLHEIARRLVETGELPTTG